MENEANSIGVKYRSAALCSLQKEISEIENAMATSEETHEDAGELAKCLLSESGSFSMQTLCLGVTHLS